MAALAFESVQEWLNHEQCYEYEGQYLLHSFEYGEFLLNRAFQHNTASGKVECTAALKAATEEDYYTALGEPDSAYLEAVGLFRRLHEAAVVAAGFVPEGTELQAPGAEVVKAKCIRLQVAARHRAADIEQERVRKNVAAKAAAAKRAKGAAAAAAAATAAKNAADLASLDLMAAQETPLFSMDDLCCD